jgi:hypothetical protein
MPNYCSNKVVLKGKEDRLDWIENIEFDFHKICPVIAFDDFKCNDERLNEGNKSEGHHYNYSWCKEMWGTKWTADICQIDRISPEELHIHFTTAWCPPEGIYKSLLAFQLDVTATYVEEGVGFFGIFRTKSALVDGCPFYKELENPHYNLPNFNQDWDTEEKCIGLMKDIVPKLEDYALLEDIAKQFVDDHLEYLEHHQGSDYED